MSAPTEVPTLSQNAVRVRHLSTPELFHAFSLCGLPRQGRPTVEELGSADELCVVCATEYERIRGFRWEDRQR